MLTLLLAVSLAFSEGDAELARTTAQGLVESCTPRDAGTIRGRVAANWLLDAASAVGADVRRETFSAETPKGRREFTNLYAAFRGQATNRWVVLVSHFDTKPGSGCPGANDGASTSGLLVAFANILSNHRDLGGNVLLVWTDGEECIDHYAPDDGLQGSRRAVAWLREKGWPVQAVLCLDMLGDPDLKITIPSNGSPVLAKIAVHAARRAGYPGLVTIIPETMKDDHVPFVEAGYKAIDLIDFSYGPDNAWWHTPQDTPDRLSKKSLLAAGRLVAEMLNILL